MPSSAGQSHASLPHASRVLAALCALNIWLLGLFAASSHLHEAVHDESATAGHTCVITLFRDGVEDPLPAIVLVAAPALFPAGEIAPAPAAPASHADVRLPPGRAPPLC